MKNCPSCGAPGADNAFFCEECGARLGRPAQQTAPQPVQQPVQQAYVQPVLQQGQQNRQQAGPAPASVNVIYNTNPDQLPPQYRPLSAWAYFGYGLLYSIPVIGFIFLIVFSLSDSNINRRSHARSYFCGLILSVIIGIVLLIIVLAGGFSLLNILKFK